MLSTSSFATSPSSLSSSSSSAAVSRFVPNPRGLLCHRQERTMSINIYNKHAQTKREREKPIGKKTEKPKQNANTRTNALTSSEDAIPSSSKVFPPTSSSSFCVDVIFRPRREGERDRDRGARNTHHPYSKTIALFLSDFVQILSRIEHLLNKTEVDDITEELLKLDRIQRYKTHRALLDLTDDIRIHSRFSALFLPGWFCV